ncbi:MAG: glycosyltransferase [Hyphomonadaceae bacterium]|nr:glycosyltransferase [Hyphomonadaceae bacterium]
MSHVTLSIVMPSFNQARFIRQSIESVLNQDFQDVELIVQDGMSDDGTVEILQEISAKDPRLKWTSEHDDGPSAAVNSGLRRADGEFVGWLNSDDLFLSGTLKTVVTSFRSNPSWQLVYGHAEHVDETGDLIGKYPTQPPTVGLDGFKAGCFICQPTVFFRRSVIERLGYLDTTLQTAFDYEYWVRAFGVFANEIGFLDPVLAQSRLHESCITKTKRDIVALEGLKISSEYLGGAQWHWAATYLDELLEIHRDQPERFLRPALIFLDRAKMYATRHHYSQAIWAIEQITKRHQSVT